MENDHERVELLPAGSATRTVTWTMPSPISLAGLYVMKFAERTAEDVTSRPLTVSTMLAASMPTSPCELNVA